jgi:hypothetical protein
MGVWTLVTSTFQEYVQNMVEEFKTVTLSERRERPHSFTFAVDVFGRLGYSILNSAPVR